MQPRHSWSSGIASHRASLGIPQGPYSESSRRASAPNSSQDMTGSTMIQMMPQPWSADVKGSGRFDQLLKAKMAAEQHIPAPSPSAPPAVFDEALSRLQGSETVFNRSFTEQYFTPAKPLSPVPPQSQPRGQSSHIPDQQQLPSASPVDANNGQLGSEQLAASFRSMVTQRINSMYETARAQGLPAAQSPQPPRLSIPETPVMQYTPASPNRSAYQSGPSPYAMIPSPTNSIAGGPVTPGLKYSYGQPAPDVKTEPEWPSSYQQPPPFMWNITPPQNNPNGMVPTSTPSLHSATDSIDSRLPPSPLTPQNSQFRQFPSPVDVKPTVSPPLAAVPLPEEGSYRQSLFPGMTQPRFTSASGEQSNSSSLGNGLYDGTNDGYLNGDTSALEGLGFGNGGDGGGGGDEHDHNGNGDQPPDMGMHAPRQKKLPLACHFCRRRKLKCDGIKPICENCNKRGIECTYDDHVRRRGPGKRTKAMREKSALDTAGSGLFDSVASAIGVGQSVEQHLQDHLQDGSDKPQIEVEDHHDLMLDPALADEIGGAGHDDVMEAMGALKQAGIELGLHQGDIDDLGEPSTLAELSGLSEQEHQQLQQLAGADNHDHLQQLSEEHQGLHSLTETEDDESRKRKAEYDLEEQSKRIKMSLTGEDDGSFWST